MNSFGTNSVREILMKWVTSELVLRMRSLPGKGGWGLLGKETIGTKV